jgi:hypothetical protein
MFKILIVKDKNKITHKDVSYYNIEDIEYLKNYYETFGCNCLIWEEEKGEVIYD